MLLLELEPDEELLLLDEVVVDTSAQDAHVSKFDDEELAKMTEKAPYPLE